MNIYALESRYSRQASFYGKAKVGEKNNGYKYLYSYGTLVCTIDSDGNTELNDAVNEKFLFSTTTMRHIKEFLMQSGKTATSTQQIKEDYYNG